MSKLNLLSTESVSTYKKFNLNDGNLYINNSRVGFEEFNGGKNIDISNHMFNLTDNIDLSGSLVVDGNTVLNGPVDIGVDLNVIGNVNIDGVLYASEFLLTSDIRLKSNINDLENGLDIIRKIKPKLYDKTGGSGHIKESGVIAQDILEIDELKYLVSEHKGIYGMNYNSLHMYSLLAIQELDKKMDKLTENIEKCMVLMNKN